MWPQSSGSVMLVSTRKCPSRTPSRVTPEKTGAEDAVVRGGIASPQNEPSQSLAGDLKNSSLLSQPSFDAFHTKL